MKPHINIIWTDISKNLGIRYRARLMIFKKQLNQLYFLLYLSAQLIKEKKLRLTFSLLTMLHIYFDIALHHERLYFNYKLILKKNTKVFTKNPSFIYFNK